MRRPFMVSLLALGIVSAGPGQAQGQSAGPVRRCARGDADVRALLRLEDEWAAALVRRDGAVFRRLLADGFVYTENDRTLSRDTVLHEVVAGADTVRAAHNESMQVHCFGTTAVVTGWLVVSGRGPGGPFERRYRFTDTWVSAGADGPWRIVAAHDYLAAPAP